MTARPAYAPHGLDALLQALRAAGLPVGPREVVRLRHVFALVPSLAQERESVEQLRDLLASALTHDRDQRELFDSVFEPWAERWSDWSRPVAERRLDQAAPFPVDRAPRIDPREQGRPRRPRLRVAVGLAAAALVALASWYFVGLQRDVDVPPPPPAADGDPVEETPAAGPRPVTSVWIRSREPVDTARRGLAWPPLLLGGFALAAAGGLAWRYGRKPWIPRILPDPKPGPRRLPLLPLAASGPELLDADAAQTLIWGVGRHVTERLTRDVDVDATVRDTAEGAGLPALRFAPEKRLREVWLWLDGMTAGDALETWAGEIAGSLAAAGLPVRAGGFDGDPEVLMWDEGQVFRPREVEAHRQTALVAVCTDGEALREELDLGDGPRVLLRSLAGWPRLAFVDFSEAGDLAGTLEPFGLRCVAPEALPAFFGLGGAPVPRRRREVDPGEIRAWRAALAFGGRRVDRALAWAVRRELALELSPWDFHLLRTGDPSDPEVPASRAGGLCWEGEGWVALAGWLAEGSLDENGIAPGSLLDRALDFWERRLEDEAEGRVERQDLDAWAEGLAERHLAMERAVLRLWREPAEAAELYQLASDDLRDAVRGRLQVLAPRDCRGDGDGRVSLPWSLEDLGDRTRYLLAELGLGGVTKGDLRRPGRLGLALGVLGSLGVGLVAWGLVPREVPLPEGTRLLVETGTRPVGDGWVEMPFVEIEGGTFRMGSEDNDPLAFPDEQPAHQVTVGDFWMGRTEVTNAQYRVSKPEHEGTDDLPANLSWIDARAYCQSLSEPGEWEYDLPTEAEWEYAARAGTTTPWSFGANDGILGEYAWFEGNSDSELQEVGRKEPSPWGLYDMHGNVWEWVLDCWDLGAYRRRARDLPIPDSWFSDDSCRDNDTASSDLRGLRGGAFDGGPRGLRSAYRRWNRPETSVRDVGFRCVRRPLRQPP